jgi:hypothetical protein
MITPGFGPALQKGRNTMKDQYEIVINKNVVYSDYDEARVFFHFEQLKKQTSGHLFLVKNGLPIRERKPII